MFMLNTMDRPVNIMAVMFVCIWGNCNTGKLTIPFKGYLIVDFIAQISATEPASF